eukprot:30807-Pelagococcus_subviridis.AAC.7
MRFSTSSFSSSRRTARAPRDPAARSVSCSRRTASCTPGTCPCRRPSPRAPSLRGEERGARRVSARVRGEEKGGRGADGGARVRGSDSSQL